MKLNWIAEWKCNEIEFFAYIAMFTGIMMFLCGLFFDKIFTQGMVAHHEGLGLFQLLWCAFWGIFSTWGMLIGTRWGE